MFCTLLSILSINYVFSLFQNYDLLSSNYFSLAICVSTEKQRISTEKQRISNGRWLEALPWVPTIIYLNTCSLLNTNEYKREKSIFLCALVLRCFTPKFSQEYDWKRHLPENRVYEAIIDRAFFQFVEHKSSRRTILLRWWIRITKLTNNKLLLTICCCVLTSWKLLLYTL